MPTAPLFGLVLAGGASARMGRDKAVIAYHGRSQLEWTYALISDVCAATFVSVRPDQRDEPVRAGLPQIVDRQPGIGPIAGISAALQEHPKAAWLVVACDLPFITRASIDHLINQRNPSFVATAYRSAHDQLPEPLCAIWEPVAREELLAYVANAKQCPRKFLINARTHLIDLPDTQALDNINTRDEFQAASEKLSTGTNAAPSTQNASRRPLTLRVQYYALFREQAGRSEETLDTFASTPEELYRELQSRHPFELAQQQLKVAVNNDFREWQTPLANGDTIVFIPPVAGG